MLPARKKPGFSERAGLLELDRMAKQPKFYVVWKGLKTGVFDTWDQCQAQVAGYSGAKFKAFSTRAAAEEAFEQDYEQFEGQNTKTLPLPPAELAKLWQSLLDEPERAREMGERARAVAEARAMAVERTWAIVAPYLATQQPASGGVGG